MNVLQVQTALKAHMHILMALSNTPANFKMSLKSGFHSFGLVTQAVYRAKVQYFMTLETFSVNYNWRPENMTQ